MRRARARDARLAVVGLGLSWFFIGCGGSTPDPASDSAAAGDSPPAVESTEAAPAAPPRAKKADGEMLASNEPAPAEATPAPRPATRRGQGPAAPDPSADASATTTEPAPGAAPKGDATGTNELLNLANSAAPPPADAAPKDEAPASTGTPGATGPVPYGPQAIGSGINTAAPPGSPAITPESMRSTGINGGSSSGGPPGFPAGPGGLADSIPGGSSGGGGPDDLKGPANFTTPMAGVRSFMIAVKAKDKDRLAEATALRSPQEASSERLKKLFATIVDQSISDASLDALAHDLQDYQIVGENQAKSSGRLGVILQKSNNNGGFIRRTVTARKEAKGWKVVDIGGMMEQEGIRSLPLNRGGMPKRR